MKYIIAIIILAIIIVAALFIIKKTPSPGLGQQVGASDTYSNQQAQDISASASTLAQSSMQEPAAKTYIATMDTSMGTIVLQLDPSHAPNTVANFVKLAKSGFYDGTRFHRVIEGFMIQGGDPQSKDIATRQYWGTGGPDYRFDDELTGKETYPQGTLAMANAGPNTNGSQFFIVTANPAPLPPSYTVFGKVTSGMDVALAIEKVQTNQRDMPLEDVIVNSVTISEK